MNKGLLKTNEINKAKAKSKWLKINSTGKMKCSRCENLLDICNFREIKKGRYEYKKYNSFCDFCDAKRTAIYKNKKIETIEGKVDLLMNNLNRRVRDKDLECNVDKDFILNLWEKQEGKCFYTKLQMEFGQYKEKKDLYNTNFNIVSIDRFDSSKGYTKDNTVLCCWGVNSMKQQMSYEQLLKWCSLILDNHNKAPK